MTKLDETIEALDLGPIKFKLMKESNWSVEKLDDVEKQYKGFLHVCKNYPQLDVMPTQNIDEFWHTHILDTEKYMEDCNNIFGHYLHHYPYVGMTGPEDEERANKVFEITKAIFQEDLGIDFSLSAAATCQRNNCGNTHCQSSNCNHKSDKFSADDVQDNMTDIVVNVGGKQFSYQRVIQKRPNIEQLNAA